MWEHSCLAFVGLIFFGLRAAFGLDACHLFRQPVLAIIPLSEGVQVHTPRTLPGGQGQRLVPGHETLGVGRVLPPLEPEMAVAARARTQSSCKRCPAA